MKLTDEQQFDAMVRITSALLASGHFTGEAEGSLDPYAHKGEEQNFKKDGTPFKCKTEYFSAVRAALEILDEIDEVAGDRIELERENVIVEFPPINANAEQPA